MLIPHALKSEILSLFIEVKFVKLVKLQKFAKLAKFVNLIKFV